MSGSSVSNVAPYPRRRSRESTDVHQGHPVCSDTHLKQQVGALAEQVTGGQTPIILMNDALTLGGFINPYTVISAAFAKLAQARPGDLLRFVAVDVETAQAMRRAQDRLCSPESLI